MRRSRMLLLVMFALALVVSLAACGPVNPQPPGLTPIPTLAPPQTAAPATALPGELNATSTVTATVSTTPAATPGGWLVPAGGGTN